MVSSRLFWIYPSFLMWHREIFCMLHGHGNRPPKCDFKAVAKSHPCRLAQQERLICLWADSSWCLSAPSQESCEDKLKRLPTFCLICPERVQSGHAVFGYCKENKFSVLKACRRHTDCIWIIKRTENNFNKKFQFPNPLEEGNKQNFEAWNHVFFIAAEYVLAVSNAYPD